MNTNQIKQGTIVAATDGSPQSGRAVAWAAEQAYLERRPLAVVSTAFDRTPAIAGAGYSPMPGPASGELLASASAIADEGVALARRHRPGLSVEALPLRGEPRVVITDLSADSHMIVLGSRGRGAIASRLLGSVSASVGKHAKCPVVVVRPGKRLATNNGILVGADGTEQSLPVLDFAFRQASLHDEPLTVMHCVWDLVAAYDGPSVIGGEQHPEAGLLLAESVAGFGERYPEVKYSLQLARGFADVCLSVDSQRWSQIVVGRHPAESLVRLATPSVATSVIEHAHTTVAVVPQDL